MALRTPAARGSAYQPAGKSN